MNLQIVGDSNVWIKISTLGVAAIFALSACAFSEDAGKEKPPTKVDILDTLKKDQEKEAADGILTDENVAVRFEDGALPNQFEMQISWPKTVFRVEVKVAETPVRVVQGAFEIRYPAIGGVKNKIELTSFNRLGGRISVLTLVKESPLDVVFESVKDLASDSVFKGHRAFFRPKSKIITYGRNLTFEFDQLIFDEYVDGDFKMAAHILTAIPGSVVAFPYQLNGSAIKITARKATGKLKIAMYGYNGRSGRSGDELDRLNGKIRGPDPKRRGAPGAGGLHQYGPDCPKGDEVVKIADGRFLCRVDGLPRCAKPPTDGGRGQNGEDGTSGEDAENGGNVGSLAIDIKDQTSFTVEVGEKVGVHGKPGAGGVGSPGGEGGPPGTEAEGGCPRANPGPPGNPGRPGKNGKESTQNGRELIKDGAPGVKPFLLN